MTAVEWALAAVCALLGIRSAFYWLRRHEPAASLRENVLYSVWLTGRAGLWFAVAGVFVISATISGEEPGGLKGRAFSEEFARFRWYILVPLALAAMQLVAAVLLGRRED